MLAFVEHIEILLFVGELDEHERVVIFILKRGVGSDLVFELAYALLHLLRIRKVIPEAVLGGLSLELRYLLIHRVKPESLSELLELLFVVEE